MKLIRNQRGFTLIEVLIAMTIFAFGILAVINMQLLASQTTMKARYMTEGIVLAQSKIEELSAKDYTHLDLSDALDDAEADPAVVTDPSLDKDEPSGSDQADHDELTHPKYKLYWNVRPDYPYVGTKQVRVIVKWDEKGFTKRFSLDMVKSDGD